MHSSQKCTIRSAELKQMKMKVKLMMQSDLKIMEKMKMGAMKLVVTMLMLINFIMSSHMSRREE